MSSFTSKTQIKKCQKNDQRWVFLLIYTSDKSLASWYTDERDFISLLKLHLSRNRQEDICFSYFHFAGLTQEYSECQHMEFWGNKARLRASYIFRWGGLPIDSLLSVRFSPSLLQFNLKHVLCCRYRRVTLAKPVLTLSRSLLAYEAEQSAQFFIMQQLINTIKTCNPMLLFR